MNWKTIRVLTKNLEELIGQYNRGEHIVPNSDRALKDDWWVGICSLSAALAGQFNMKGQHVAQAGAGTFLLVAVQSIEENHFMREVIAFTAVARKLLADVDAAEAKPFTTAAA